MEALTAVLLLNKRTRILFTMAAAPVRIHGVEEGKERMPTLASCWILSCVTHQWTCFLFFSSVV